MTEEVRLEWQYTPPDYFEEPLLLELGEIRAEIADGTITAHVPAARYSWDSGIRDSIEEDLKYHFLAVQLISHNPYKIAGPKEYRTNAQGKEETTVHLKAPDLEIGPPVLGHPHLKELDADVNAISDTKAERIARERRIADLLARHASTDATLRSILAAYGEAIKDPAHKLVHLFAVGDALKKRFSGEKSARQATGVSESRWKLLGRLANDEPLRQGRHRGQHPVDDLRDATPAELDQAGSIAAEMIEGYLAYLDSQD